METRPRLTRYFFEYLRRGIRFRICRRPGRLKAAIRTSCHRRDKNVWHCDVTSLIRPSCWPSATCLRTILGVFAGMFAIFAGSESRPRTRCSRSTTSRAQLTPALQGVFENPPQFVLRLSRLCPGSFRGFDAAGESHRQGPRNSQTDGGLVDSAERRRSSRLIRMASIFVHRMERKWKTCNAGSQQNFRRALKWSSARRLRPCSAPGEEVCAPRRPNHPHQGCDPQMAGMEPYAATISRRFCVCCSKTKPERAVALPRGPHAQDPATRTLRRSFRQDEACATSRLLSKKNHRFVTQSLSGVRARLRAARTPRRSNQLLHHRSEQEGQGLRERPIGFGMEPRSPG